MVRPNGAETVGPAAICEGQNESFARFRATQHVMTNHVVDLAGEHARVRANVIATHLWAPGQGDPVALESHFTAGGVITVGRVANRFRLRSDVSDRAGPRVRS